MPVKRFLSYSAIAAVAWSLVTGLEYYWFGRAVESADTWVQIVIVIVGLAVDGPLVQGAAPAGISASAPGAR